MTSYLFELVYILLDKKKQTARQLADHFGVSVRTIYRWIEQLCIAGVPLYMTKGRGGGISLMDGYVLDKAVFSDAEKTDIIASLKAMQSVSISQQESAAVTKLSGMFKLAGDTNWIEADFSSWNSSAEESSVFDTLKQAITGRHVVSFLYYNGNGERMERIVEPWRLVFREHSWYLWGYCRMRAAERLFKLRRVTNLKMLPDTCTHSAPNKSFRSAYGKAQWENDHQNIPVTVKIGKSAVFRVRDEFPPERIVMQPDGSALISFCMPDADWFYGYLLGFGTELEVLNPEPVRAEMRRRLCELTNVYSRNTN